MQCATVVRLLLLRIPEWESEMTVGRAVEGNENAADPARGVYRVHDEGIVRSAAVTLAATSGDAHEMSSIDEDGVQAFRRKSC